MLNKLEKPLFILEMANNHMGDIEHGLKIVQEIKRVVYEFEDVFKFSIKLQLRDETIIHPDYRNRMDIKHIKRFTETRLSIKDFSRLKDEISKLGFISMCTPFDEVSVRTMKELDFDVFKIASCSFADWAFLEEFNSINKPIIISTGGVDLKDLDNVVSFFKHRNKDFCLMHCVTAYPTKVSDLELNQIDFLKNRFIDVPVGFSTHEETNCTDAVKLAVAKGCMVFEKHVGVPTEKYQLNGYSATPEQVKAWLSAAKEAFIMCGVNTHKRMEFRAEATEGVRLFIRGAFAKRNISKGEKIVCDSVFFAMPNFEGQILAKDFSRYSEFTAKEEILCNDPIYNKSVDIKEKREEIYSIVTRVAKMLKEQNVAVPNGVQCSISAHYGIERFYEFGAVLLDVLNREYCKKLLVMLPNQKHPTHRHKIKEETFHILSGDFTVVLDGEEKVLKKGDLLTINRGQNHSFKTENGAIFEEISTTHIGNDSYYEDSNIMNNTDRKIELTLWADLFDII